MDNAFKDGCGDDWEDQPCAICRGEDLCPEFIERMTATAAQPGRRMTAEEAIEWLGGL